MFQHKKILLLGLILVALNGCKNDNMENKEKNITNSNIKRIEVKNQKEEPKILNKIGIQADKDKIIIDTNKTKKFFEDLSKSLKKEAKKLKESTKEFTQKDLGIKKEKEKIVIDLNKTKTFLDKFSKELENIANDIEKAIEGK